MKKRIILLLISFMFVMPVVARAESSLKINCPSSSIAQGASMTCDVVGTTSDKGIAGVTFKPQTSSGLTLSEVKEPDSSWSFNNNDDGTYSIIYNGSDSTVAPSGTTLAKLTVTADANLNNGDKLTISLSDGSLSIKAEEDSPENATDDPCNDTSLELTVGESNGGGVADNGNSTSQNANNPKTMDTNMLIIGLILLIAFGALVVGKKKLNKLS